MDLALAADWLNLLSRWFHMTVGITWIGTSFYFMSLDYQLKAKAPGAAGPDGSAWEVHGGGFYQVGKYLVAPADLPPDLIWHRWAAYLTWTSGFVLLVVQYYWNARGFLIDPTVAALQPWQAIGLSLGAIVGGWLVYDALCRSPLAERPALLSVVVFLLIVAAAWGFTHVFSGRGAFIHVGVFIGTIMAANVFLVIIPNQKIVVADLIAGRKPDPKYGKIGKTRSTHNNYLTLPVLLMMVSNHYPMLYGHPASWLIVALVVVCGALVQHTINRHEAGDPWQRYGWAVPVAAIALVAMVFVTAERPRLDLGSAGTVTELQALDIAARHCAACHARQPRHPGFTEAPKGVTLETAADLRRFSGAIVQQSVQSKAMPLGNETGMTDAERAALGAFLAGAR
ncbi:urate hydroxylase PuuD [Phreatobacter sp. AB_2022a]|uniref:urate hydroxylase PuuD n=1 Tax=Phreatobacter sp. AB_2022a TaxID=3003134 RepID=UPI002287472D|nr:urate hydroxylase PuuD [Phreatobacter sp. AB_2022a]MCZ0733577.1 urate hydroxylase PuuD [Phreatobacter sp. AB_2022a]